MFKVNKWQFYKLAYWHYFFSCPHENFTNFFENVDELDRATSVTMPEDFFIHQTCSIVQRQNCTPGWSFNLASLLPHFSLCHMSQNWKVRNKNKFYCIHISCLFWNLKKFNFNNWIQFYKIALMFQQRESGKHMQKKM